MADTPAEERPEPLATFDRLERRLDDERHYRTLSDEARVRDRESHGRLQAAVVVLAFVLAAAVVVGVVAVNRFGDVVDSVHAQTTSIRSAQVNGTPLGRKLVAGEVVLLCAAVNIVFPDAHATPASGNDRIVKCLARNGVKLRDLIDVGVVPVASSASP